MTAEEVKEILRQLEEFDFSNYDNLRYREYKRIFFSAFNEADEFPIWDIPMSDQQFSRCRKNENNHLYVNRNQVWAPPTGKGKIGRLNYQGDPIFYASHNAATALLEVRPSKEDIITVLTFKLKHPTVRGIQLGAEVLQRGEIQFKSEVNRVLYDFIAKECKKVVPEDKPELYTPTILFAKGFSQNHFDAYVYESVSAKYNGINFAFKSEYIEHAFDFVEARIVRIKEVSENMDYKVECIYVATEFEEDGITFKWEETPYCYGHYVTMNDLGEQMDGLRRGRS